MSASTKTGVGRSRSGRSWLELALAVAASLAGAIALSSLIDCQELSDAARLPARPARPDEIRGPSVADVMLAFGDDLDAVDDHDRPAGRWRLAPSDVSGLDDHELAERAVAISHHLAVEPAGTPTARWLARWLAATVAEQETRTRRNAP